MDSAIDDIDFLARSNHRVGVLEELTENPCDRADLRAATGASSPTMGRLLTDFEDRQWIVRNAHTYELTPLGEFVAERFFDLYEAMTTERKLRDVWQWLPREMEEFSVELFADAVVSYPGPGYPYKPVERIAILIEETSTMRGFGTLELKSANLKTMCGAVLNGTEMEYVFSPEILETTFAWNPKRIAEVAACENCTVLVHDALPDEDRCGLSILDDRVAICCHDPDTNLLTAVVDTDAPAARSWAISVFERYLREATPVEPDSVDALVSSDLLP